jgi:putative membrane protein (TIGR04086 family)
MVKVNENNSQNTILKVLKGSLLAILASVLMLIILAAFLTYTNVNESVIPTVLIIITGISILIGSQITTSSIKKNGILNGILVGTIYIIMLYLLSSAISKNFSLNNYSIIMIATSIIIGGLGGIIGVNRK